MTKRIASAKDELRKTYKPFTVTMCILSCVSSIEVIQWMNTTGQLESLLAKYDQLTNVQSAEEAEDNVDDAVTDDDDGEESPWMRYLADFTAGNARKLRRDVFLAVSPFYIEQSRLANLNLFAEIPSDDDLSMIKYLIDDAVHDFQTMLVYASFASALKEANAALNQ